MFNSNCVLDVGCGSKGKGNYLEGDHIIHVDIDKDADADVLMDVFHLGFQSNCFDIVHASHLIEHLTNPNPAIQEMKRVSKKNVVIKVPNASYFKATTEDPDHIYSWNRITLENFLRKHFTWVKVYGNILRLERTRNKLRTLKIIALSLFLGSDELIAVCRANQ